MDAAITTRRHLEPGGVRRPSEIGRWRNKLRAVVWDMDGVLVDSEPIHLEALNAVLKGKGEALTEEEFLKYIGTTVETTWNDLNTRFPNLGFDMEEYKRRYELEIIPRLRQPLQKQPGVDRVLGWMRDRGLRLALASSSRRSWVDATLEGLGLTEVVPVVVSGEEPVLGKPAPDIFLLAARRLGLRPDECLAIEDSPAGVASADAAGMRVVAVRTPYTQGLPLPGADVILESLEDFPEDLLT